MTLGFIRPKTVGELLEVLAEYKDGSKIVAGATDLLVQQRNSKQVEGKPLYLVDITGIPELAYICLLYTSRCV